MNIQLVLGAIIMVTNETAGCIPIPVIIRQSFRYNSRGQKSAALQLFLKIMSAQHDGRTNKNDDDHEVMFRASTDDGSGKPFGDKINLSIQSKMNQ